MIDITQQQLSEMLGNPDREAIAAIWTAPLNAAMRASGITTPQRQAAFLSQLLPESSEFHVTQENLNFSADTLRRLWPSRFSSPELASAYGHAPEKLGNYLYANRIGNGDEASGDGWKYRGRGLIAITGREQYTRFSKATQIDALHHPDLLLEPAGAAQAATWFWQTHGFNELADTLDGRDAELYFLQICKRMSGSSTRMDQRRHCWQRALKVLGAAA